MHCTRASSSTLRSIRCAVSLRVRVGPASLLPELSGTARARPHKRATHGQGTARRVVNCYAGVTKSG